MFAPLNEGSNFGGGVRTKLADPYKTGVIPHD